MARLRSVGTVVALVSDRIWHRAPEDAVFPYIAGFDTAAQRDDATCIQGSAVTMNVHAWTRDGIDPLQDARSIAFEVAQALHGYPLALPGNHLVTLDHRGDRVFYDLDGLTGHAVIEFHAVIQS